MSSGSISVVDEGIHEDQPKGDGGRVMNVPLLVPAPLLEEHTLASVLLAVIRSSRTSTTSACVLLQIPYFLVEEVDLLPPPRHRSLTRELSRVCFYTFQPFCKEI